MRTTKLCVTVTGRTMSELRERRDQVVGADLVELRMDGVSDPSAAGAVAGRRTPIVVTCRPAWEGGWFAGSEEERHRLLQDAQRLGAEYVDVEWRAGFTDLLSPGGGRGIVLSHHDFDGVPTDLASLAASMRATGAEIVKLAVTATRLSDTLALVPIGRRAADTVLVAMGDAGVATRILPQRFGSSWTYAGEGVAPGQLSVSRLQGELSFDTIDEGTAIYGVVGRPVMHSLSPTMHNAAFRATALNAVYLPLAAADFADFVTFAEALGIAGTSVTAPFKLDALQRAREADETSRRIGAANTLKAHVDGGWSARNTDGAGFMAPLASITPVRGLRAIVFGAGGAARAVGDALSAAGARVSIAARQRERADRVAQLVGASVSPWPPERGSWDLLVNATPAGTIPNTEETPLPNPAFTGRLVYDLVYNPLDTRFLRDARASGCRTIGGLEMLVAQAAQQFTWWTGQDAPIDVMRAAALSTLGTPCIPGTL